MSLDFCTRAARRLRLLGLGRKPAANLTHGTSQAKKREKMYRITEKGETAFRFCADPGTNTLVRSMLEGT